MMLIQPLTERSKVVTNQLPEYDGWQIYNRTLTGGQNRLRIYSIHMNTTNLLIIVLCDYFNLKCIRRFIHITVNS